ncbi:MAG TPA: hypothetical protein ENH34_05240 [Phycisphaerales bacterium]|nr:hypothetical protein [Phycisphaerales bacterium]
MKRPAQKVFVLAIGVIMFMLIAGCEEQNVSGTKKGRLIANENRQLKKELKQRDKEIEKQEKLLEKCLQDKKGIKERLQRNTQDQANDILAVVIEESAKLRQENERLKTQIEQLKNKSKN